MSARMTVDAGGESARRPANQEPSLKQRALRHLARREYAREELRKKLLPYLLPEQEPQELDDVLERLQQNGLLSDERAADSIVRQKAARFGCARIKQELQTKGIDKEYAAAALQTLAETELERARLVWQAKFKPTSSDEEAATAQERAKLKAKQMRFLLGRGFSAAVAMKLINEHR